MEKDVLISIRGLQYLMDEESGEQEPVEVMTTGSYYKKNGHHFLIYDEATEGFDMMTHNMIKFTENALEVRKRGLIDVHMIFEEDKKNISFYHTPYGMINMGVAATKVRMKETPRKQKETRKACFFLFQMKFYFSSPRALRSIFCQKPFFFAGCSKEPRMPRTPVM